MSTGSTGRSLGRHLVINALLFSSVPGFIVCINEHAGRLISGGPAYPMVMMAALWTLFLVVGVAGMILFLGLGWHRDRLGLFPQAAAVTMSLYPAAILIGIAWLKISRPDADISIYIPASCVLGVVLFIAQAFKPASGLVTGVIFMLFFLLLFLGWLISYPERGLISYSHLYPVFLHLGFLALIVAAAFRALFTLRNYRTKHAAILSGALWVAAAVLQAIPGSSGPSACRVDNSFRARRPAAEGRPDIIFIVMDTVRKDRMSLYGYDRPTTPALSQLARDAVVYENMISVSPWTLPSHASMFTGLFPREHGARNYFTVKNGKIFSSRMPLGQEFLTLAEILAKRYGYQTGAVAANFSLLNHFMGLDQGFDFFCNDPNPRHFDLQRLQARLIGDYPVFGAFIRLGRMFAGSNQADFLSAYFTPCMSAREVNAHALEWMASAPAPRFLFLNYMEAHGPLYPPEEFAGKFRASGSAHFVCNPLEALPKYRELEILSGARQIRPEEKLFLDAGYDAEILYLDHELGALLNELQSRGLYDSSLIIITSDHGEFLGEHNLFRHGWTLHEQMLRVPLMIKYPRSSKTGVINEPIQSTDLFYLLLGITENKAVDPPRPALIAEWYNPGTAVNYEFKDRYLRDSRAAYFDEFKLVLNSSGGDELYNLKNDPDEKFNLVETNPDAYLKGKQIISSYLSRTQDRYAAGEITPEPVSREQRKKLEALGYFQ